jgi:hypothetical protein
MGVDGKRDANRDRSELTGLAQRPPLTASYGEAEAMSRKIRADDCASETIAAGVTQLALRLLQIRLRRWRQDPAELVARGDAQLGEHRAQMSRDRVLAEE